MTLRNTLLIARKEVRDSLRNRWFLLYGIAFAALALALSLFSLAGTGLYGQAGFGRTAAGLVNLVLLIVPLMALSVGAGAIAGERERGTLAYLLSHPITRTELLAGKYLGLGAALLAALGLGFGISAAALAAKGVSAGAGDYVGLVLLSFVLALAMLSVSLLISSLSRKASVAGGIALFLWLLLVFGSDLGLMGSAVVFRLRIDELFGLSLINPLQVYKMAILDGLHATLDVLGPVGTYAMQQYGGALGAIFAGVLAAWIVLPLAAAHLVFLRRE